MTRHTAPLPCLVFLLPLVIHLTLGASTNSPLISATDATLSSRRHDSLQIKRFNSTRAFAPKMDGQVMNRPLSPLIAMLTFSELATSIGCNSIKHILPIERGIVVTRYNTDLTWLEPFLHSPSLHLFLYQKDDLSDTTRLLAPNKGHEAMGYLAFILEYYDCLPNRTFFIHGHNVSKHTSAPMTEIMNRLRWNASLPFFSVNLRRYAVRQRHQATWEFIEEVWDQLFRKDLGDIPSFSSSHCCAQFVVARERILLHKPEFYRNILHWLVETPMTNHVNSRVLEHTWHLIFGEPHDAPEVHPCQVLTCDDQERYAEDINYVGVKPVVNQ